MPNANISNGFLAINKPSGWTSFDVVNKLKHMLKPNKVGHLGTLDPMAKGVLLITVGKATKLFNLMQEKQKTYLAKFEFGYETDTLDSSGKIIGKCNNIPTLEQINSVLPKFIGKISQIPPKYSAKSVNGKRAYDLARQNIDFDLQPKIVEIFNLKIIDYSQNVLTIEICCGSGTYIRSLARDIGNELNSLATMTELTRTQVGEICLKNCLELPNLNEQNIKQFILPINKLLKLPEIDLNEDTSKLLNGQTLKMINTDGLYILKDKQNCLAIVKICNNLAKMTIYFG